MASSDVNHLSQPCIYGDFVSSYGERKSRLTKWLTKLFKGGSSGRRGGSGASRSHPQLIGDENMAWRVPIRSLDGCPRSQREEDELEHAIALSRAEDLRRPGGHRWRTDHDEEIARALQDGRNSPFYSPHAPAHHRPHIPRLHPPPAHPRHPQQYHSWGYKICGGCKGEIWCGNYLGCMGTYFHPQCFRCHACDLPITENEFSLSGRDPYHKICFKELAHPKCDVCRQFIPTNQDGLIEYRCHPFWSQKYCPAHEHDATARCCSCERLESWDSRHVSVGDGRSICFECFESAIMDTGDCQPLYHAIRDFFEGMNMKIDQQIPCFLLKDRHLMKQLSERGAACITCLRQGVYVFLKSRQLPVYGVRRRPRIGGRQLIGMTTQPQRLARRCEVTAILVLFGLPRLLTGAILAHELMHGWLRLKGFRNLNPDVEEGICQVLSHMWLESEVMPGSRGMPSTSAASSSYSSSSKKGGRSSVENKLGEFFMHQIVNDASPAYGEDSGQLMQPSISLVYVERWITFIIREVSPNK